jgi:hypothetical protein
MSLLPLGLLSQGGGAPAVDGFEPISSTVLSSAQASITISSIPATYSALQLRVVGRSATGANYDDLLLRFNSDSAGNYSWKNMDTFNYFNSTQGVSESGIRIYGLGGGNLTSGAFGGLSMEITGYRNTNMRTLVRGMGGAFSFAGNFSGRNGVFNGLWNPTTTVTSLTVSAISGANLIAGTRVSLYGVL